MEKRYQIFVSSTYEDLKEERKEVTQAILRCDCFPAGMELFPASSREKWEVIKRSIDDSDIFLVILAGRYGSFGKDDDGNEVGYTEMEFDYALSQGKSVIALLHKDLGTLPSSAVDGPGTKERKMLDEFRRRVQRERMTRYWSNQAELGAEVMASLHATMRDDGTKLLGWTRLDHFSQTDVVWTYDTTHDTSAPIANGDTASRRDREIDRSNASSVQLLASIADKVQSVYDSSLPSDQIEQISIDCKPNGDVAGDSNDVAQPEHVLANTKDSNAKSEYDSEMAKRYYRMGQKAFLSFAWESAADNFRIGCALEDDASWIALAEMMMGGYASPKNHHEWKTALSHSGLSGNDNAWYELGVSYLRGRYRQDDEQALAYFSLASNSGQRDMLCKTAMVCLDKGKLTKDYDMRSIYIESANVAFEKLVAMKDTSDALIGLGETYAVNNTRIYDLSSAHNVLSSYPFQHKLSEKLAYGIFDEDKFKTNRKFHRVIMTTCSLVPWMIIIVNELLVEFSVWTELYLAFALLFIIISVICVIPYVIFYRTEYASFLMNDNKLAMSYSLFGLPFSIAILMYCSRFLITEIYAHHYHIYNQNVNDIKSVLSLIALVIAILIELVLRIKARDRKLWKEMHKKASKASTKNIGH